MMKAKFQKAGSLIKRKAKTIFGRVGRDQRGQGMTEYALLLLVVVAMVAVFKDKIKEAVSGKLGNVADEISQFSGKDQ